MQLVKIGSLVIDVDEVFSVRFTPKDASNNKPAVALVTTVAGGRAQFKGDDAQAVMDAFAAR